MREQVLQAVAVIFKRASLDAGMINKEALYTEVTQLIATGDLSLVSLGFCHFFLVATGYV